MTETEHDTTGGDASLTRTGNAREARSDDEPRAGIREARDDDEPRAAASGPRVVITGFMAAGKTAVGRALARLLGCAFADTDELVRARAGRTPAEIIEADGEARFRELESLALRDALAPGGPLVVATGGGTWLSAANRALAARRDCLSVWLDAPFELCLRRIEAEARTTTRPLARDAGAARALYEARRASYALAALRVEVATGRTAESIAAEIANLLGRRQHSDGQTNETGEPTE
jgi:shikimate kinase